MWVIAEMEWDYNNLDYLGVYGPFYSEAKAKKVYDKLMQNRKSHIGYEIKKVEKLKFRA